MSDLEKKYSIGVYARMNRVHSVHQVTPQELDPQQSIRNAILKAIPDIAASSFSITKQFGEHGRDDVYAVEICSSRDDVRSALAKSLPTGFELSSLDFEPDKLVDVEVEIQFAYYHHFGDDLEILTERLFQHMRSTVKRDTEVPEFTVTTISDANTDTGVSDFKVVFHRVPAKSSAKLAYNVRDAIPNLKPTTGVVLSNFEEE